MRSHKRYWTTTALLLAAAVALHVASPIARAQPEPTLIFPQDGAVLAEPPKVIHMCFASPVNIRDLGKGGDFLFTVGTPTGRGLGLQVAFEPDGLGVDIHPDVPPGLTQGQWTFKWRVTDANSLSAEGTTRFTVGPGGSLLPPEPPEACAAPSTAPGASSQSNQRPDIELMALITAAAVGGVAVVGTILYVIRQRIGFWLHRPPPRSGGEGTEHH